jgi:hypothetical protein
LAVRTGGSPGSILALDGRNRSSAVRILLHRNRENGRAQLQTGLAAGSLSALVEGNGGNDLLSLLADISSGPLQPHLLANGGAGFDVAIVSPAVGVVGVEQVIVSG